ncbi:major facilitator superfamily domain-containing protein [Protomyces lactucae-debilis]|uniref:Major facilitator superfamily domain-containing protein n=1 Tax=Protomyces lactucae-debilis TaxID=2754530 RepID=A0A1Y2F688_PROLT|nr:major facilitator superfamily domain-containing protein [Protomyces lactucae-debilis]ORY78994.1 major facilitator superfamily domain-containing protein [Protomyces lactucae-debilis]
MSGPEEDIRASDKEAATQTVAAYPENSTYPEGGYGWICVLGSALIFFNGWGFSNAFGVFQTYYEIQFPDSSASVIALIGSLQACLIEGTGMLVGVFVDRYGMRPVMLVGAILQVGALLAASFSTKIWHLYLSQGVMYGLGAGALYIVAVSVPGQWFHKRKATAYGILYTSSGLGGVLWPIILTQLFGKVGFGWTMRITMFITLVQVVIGCLLLRERPLSQPSADADEKSGRAQEPRVEVQDVNIYKSKTLWYCAAGYFILSIGMLSPMFYIGTFAKVNGMSDHLSFYLLSMLNTASIPGRTICGWLADRYGRMNALCVSIFAAALVQLIMWSTIRTNAEIILFSCFYGFSFGGLISLMPAVTAQVCGQQKLASKFGVVSALGGAGTLVGAPIAALFIGDSPESYLGCILFSGFCMLLATAWYTGLRFYTDRRIFVVL